MAQQGAAAGGEETRRLVSKLKEVRGQIEGRPTDQRRRDLMRALQEELAGLSEEEAGRRIEQARETLVGEARDRERSLEGVQGEVSRLKAEVEVLKAAREVLARENQQLRKTLEGAEAQGGSSQSLEKIRAGLRKMADGDEVTPDAIGLPPSEARLFRLAQELLGFALKIEFSVQSLLADFGAVRGADTMFIRGMDKMIRNRFRACLENKQGSIQALREGLDKNLRFLLQLNDAYLAATRKGVPSLLAELDPEQLLEQHRGRLMTNYEEAFRSFSTRHTDLANLTPKEAWERFFQQAFREKLEEVVAPDAGSA
jgi:hypothetical protein